MSFNHALGVKSDFSIGQSMLQVDHIIEKAKEMGFESVAVTDVMSIHSMIDFSNKAKKSGIRPVVGCAIRVVKDPTYRKPSKASGIKEVPNPGFTIKVYPRSERGLKCLIKLLSKGNSADYFYYVSRVGMDDVMEMEDVVVTTGDFFNLFHYGEYESVLERLKSKFPTYVELVPINTPLFDTLNLRALDAAEKVGAPTLVTYPFLYREPGDGKTLDVLGVIATQEKMDSERRPMQYVQNFHWHDPKSLLTMVKSAALRCAARAGTNSQVKLWTAGVTNMDAFVGLCAYEFKKMPVCLPTMSSNDFGELCKLVKVGFQRRLTAPVLGYQPADLTPYIERVKYELSVLNNLGFCNYFLLVADLVNWAKNNGVIVGPGRGSVGGSLIAYLIGITDVDPLRFDLIFERFINPQRQDLPDADLDFASSRRHLVVEYLRDKYGADRVAGISNYATMASASALRDTGRVFGLSGLDMMATKLVPKEHGQSYSLTDAADAVPELDKFRSEWPNIWEHATKLEGAMRSFGTHAAGVVVAGEPLVERAVVETRGETPVVNWDKRVVEDMGLVKMDVLGLSTLDVLEIARQYIKERHGVDVDYLSLPLEEPDIMDSFGRGDTTGVFQFESPGMKKLLRDMASGGRLNFEDITAATALYRPGPMDSGMMDEFVQIKQGHRTPYYEHPNMEPALTSTYGVNIYQEQTMRLAVDLAGFTGPEADALRKAIGKKDKDKMAELRLKWNEGCQKHSGMTEGNADRLFDKIEANAGYQFNKSHATAYSIVSYLTMWVRVRYPAEYFAACMSIVKDDKLPGLVKDAREYGIEIMPPDINRSTDRYVIPDNKHILAPFCSVKGISDTTARRIMELRDAAGGWFSSVEDFKRAAAAKGSKVNKTVVERLDLVGAYWSLDRATKPPRDMSRRKDQMELMPGLIIDSLKADRTTDLSAGFLRTQIIELAKDYKNNCDGCSLAGQPHPTVRCKSKVKFMVVTDSPTWQEEKADKLLEGDSAAFIKAAIASAELSVAEGYYTTLVKAKKDEKFLTNAQINGCAKYLEKEIQLIKPAVIVALGSATIKRLLPGLKQSPSEMVGQAVYDPKLDASIVCGLNPVQLVFDPSKAEQLVETFKKVAEIVN